MNRLRNITLLFSALVIFGAACSNSSSNEEDLIISNTINDVPADVNRTGNFTFINLTTGEIITDSASTNWDLGFAATNIITNSGVSGPGAGGAASRQQDVERDRIPEHADAGSCGRVGRDREPVRAPPRGSGPALRGAWYPGPRHGHGWRHPGRRGA